MGFGVFFFFFVVFIFCCVVLFFKSSNTSEKLNTIFQTMLPSAKFSCAQCQGYSHCQPINNSLSSPICGCFHPYMHIWQCFLEVHRSRLGGLS